MKGMLSTHHARTTFDFDGNDTVKVFWNNLLDPHLIQHKLLPELRVGRYVIDVPVVHRAF